MSAEPQTPATTAPQTAAWVPPLSLVADRFALEAFRGAGGMGSVYLAHDRFTGERVAVKLLRSELKSRHRERFAREAALLAELRHPGIVRHVAHGLLGGGQAYLAMEWLEGETLHARLRRGPLSQGETVTLARKLLVALTAIHRVGIIHRDIKPSNIMLVGGSVEAAKILDFGIARRHVEAAPVTVAGAAPGTPMYMAPEQARATGPVDHRCDIFSLGCVLFECLTGEPLFTGETPLAILARICTAGTAQVRQRLPAVSPTLVATLERMLVSDVTGRAPDAAALAEALFELPTVARGDAAQDVRRESIGASDEQRMAPVLLVRLPEQRQAGGPEGVPMDLIQSTLAPYSAQLSRFVRGTALVTFQDTVAPTDQCRIAARAALRLLSVVPSARIALSLGPVVLGSTGSFDRVIDRAADLLGRTRGPSIVLDDASAAVLSSHFVLRGRSPRRLAGVRTDVDAVGTVLGKKVPCVGREREILTLEAFYGECARDSVARVVLVTAPAGAGKSRLRYELIERIRGRKEEFELLVGLGDPIRGGAPLGLIGSAVRAAARISGSEPADAQRARLAAFVQRRVGASIATRVTAFLGELAGVSFPDEDNPALKAARQDARLMADQMLAAWIDWLEAASAAGPVVLVLEDLHWGDSPSVQFVDAALRRLSGRPFLVLALARPEVEERFPGLWAEREVQAMALVRLGAKACEKVVRAVLGDLPSEKLGWLVERADGNPFYLEELLRAVGSGMQVGDGAVVPATVLGMVQARLDTLGTDAKRVLRAASVFGQTFRASGVRAPLSARDDDRTVDDWLEILEARELVFAGREGEHVFRHALIRDAAYDMLPDADRRTGHRLAGDYLERAGEQDASVLVEHFERGGHLPEAAYWSRYAAEQALGSEQLRGGAGTRGTRREVRSDGRGARVPAGC